MTHPDDRLDPTTSRKLLDVAYELFAERNVSVLCEKVLNHAQNLTNSDGGTLYISQPNAPETLDFVIVKNHSLNIHQGGTSNNAIQFLPLPLYTSSGQKNDHCIATQAAHERSLINIKPLDDIHTRHQVTTNIDLNNDYRTESVLALALVNQTHQLIGVLQLINAMDKEGNIIAFDTTSELILSELGRFAAAALDQQLQMNSQRALLTELSSATTPQQLLPKILKEAQALTMADAGTIYLLADEEDQPQLTFSVIRNNTLSINLELDKSEKSSEFASIPLQHESGQDNTTNVASYCANSKQLINIPDAYSNNEFCFEGTKAFDRSTGYKSQSFLTVPLLNHNQDVIGVLQLINAKDPSTGKTIAFNPQLEPLINGLASYAAIALNNQILLQDHKDLLDAFIQCIAKAIDAKSPHTSAHCQRVPLLMELIAQAACDDQETFKEFNLNEDEWYELRVSAWLHDCGKLATPDTVLEKSTKLHKMQDGIELINTRLASIYALTQSSQTESISHSELLATTAFLSQANQGGEFMSEADQQRVRELSQLQWQDLSGQWHPLLSKEEVDQLCIPRGTLSQDERNIINNHMHVTIEMLESLPFPKKLKRVPEYAGGHHERMDGTGFPKGLLREEMSLPARMMAIADIFEALTARDRPYKPPMPLSQALSILKNMKDSQHIDPDLFNLFIRAEVWRSYSNKVLLPEQNDLDCANHFLD